MTETMKVTTARMKLLPYCHIGIILLLYSLRVTKGQRGIKRVTDRANYNSVDFITCLYFPRKITKRVANDSNGRHHNRFIRKRER